MKFGLEFLPTEPYWKLVYYGIMADREGFDYIMVTDHYNNRNVYVILTAIASYTDRVSIGPGVTNPYLIHPVVTAQCIASLTELAGDRVFCGIGAGDRATLSALIGERPSPIKAVKEAVEIVRGMLEKGGVSYEGEVFRVKGARFNFAPKGRPRILIGAQGPRMLRLAAAIGDGVMINASHPKDFEVAMKGIDEGLREAGKARGGFEVMAATSVSIAEDPDRAKEAAKPVVAFIVAGSPRQVLERHGIDEGVARAIAEDIGKARWKDAFSKVSDEMMDRFTIAGDPDYVAKRFEGLKAMGVDTVIIGSPIGPDVIDAIGMLSEVVRGLR